MKLYKISRESFLENSQISRAFLVEDISESDSNSYLVYKKSNGQWFSADRGFSLHGDSSKSRLIKAVKLYEGERDKKNLYITSDKNKNLRKIRVGEKYYDDFS